MADRTKSFWCPLFIIIPLIIFATSALAVSDLNFSKARDIDPVIQTGQSDKTADNSTSMASPTRTDADGHLIIYVIEPTGRWLDFGQVFPTYAPKPFGNAVIAYPYDEDVYLSESFDLTFDWDGTAAGFGDITEGNIKVVAAYSQAEATPTYVSAFSCWYNAHYIIAAADAYPGVPGSNYTDGDYTHTVLIEEAASEW